MKYSTKHRFSGSESAAFSAVEATLLPNGFRITRSESTRLQLKGRGARSTKENPIRGATEISVEAVGGVLRLDATLGGVRFLALFVCLFPLLLWCGLAGAAMIKSGTASSVLGSNAVWGAAIWILVGPAMAYWIRKRTIGALDDMLANASVVAGRENRN